MKFHPWMAWEIKRDQYSRLEFETPYKAYECLFYGCIDTSLLFISLDLEVLK